MTGIQAFGGEGQYKVPIRLLMPYSSLNLCRIIADVLVCPQTGELVALKKVPLRKLEDGIPNSALREIKALQESEENNHVCEISLVLGSKPIVYTLIH